MCMHKGIRILCVHVFTILNLHLTLRPIMHFSMWLGHFVCNRPTCTSTMIEKLKSEDVAVYTYMYIYGISVCMYYAYTGSQFNGLGQNHSK